MSLQGKRLCALFQLFGPKRQTGYDMGQKILQTWEREKNYICIYIKILKYGNTWQSTCMLKVTSSFMINEKQHQQSLNHQINMLHNPHTLRNILDEKYPK